MKDSVNYLQKELDSVNVLQREKVYDFTRAMNADDAVAQARLTDSIQQLQFQTDQLRNDFKNISKKVSSRDTNDTNYVFLSFVKDYLPSGLKGLLIAIIFLAAWGSIAAALNSLAASTVVDFHYRIAARDKPVNEYRVSKWYTVGWGIFCIIVAQFAGQVAQSLIEAVNVLGSLFYGVILGIFLVAFYIKSIKGHAAFWGAVIVEAYIIISTIWPWLTSKIPFLVTVTPKPIFDFLNSAATIGFLWLNVIGALGTVAVALILQLLIGKK